MKGLFFFVMLGMLVSSCQEKTEGVNCFPCSIEATVKDLRSLEGCDFVFELKDGTRLIPERRTYIQEPTKEADPVYHYQFNDGTKVTIGFETSNAMSACMAGKIVFVTCIKNLPTTEQ